MTEKTYFDTEEQKIIESFEGGEFVEVKDLTSRKNILTSIAEETLSKRTPINIRVLSADIWKLKEKAEEEGIPYQTLITSVLHKYATWKFEMKK